MQELRDSAQTPPNCTWSDEQRTAVREEIKRIFAHSTFRGSHRCSAFLGYVVKRALDGEECEIKERTVGVEVFERAADYDIGSDPVVRRMANEVRKRIAQYYQDDPNGHVVKINLPRGGYIPEFEFLPEACQKFTTKQNLSNREIPSVLPQSSRLSTLLAKFQPGQWALVAITFMLLIAAVLIVWDTNFIFRSPINRVWKPLLDSKGAVIVCLPDRRHNLPHAPEGVHWGTQDSKETAIISQPGGSQFSYPPSESGVHGMSLDQPTILFGDMAVGHSITNFLSHFNKHYELRSSSELNYAEFQHGPTILIGGVNNQWVSALLSNLRYSVQYNMATGDSWIQDAQAPSQRDWKINVTPDHAPPSTDYAVITRVFNQGTGQWILALSGAKGYGTKAASKLLTDPKLEKEIPNGLHDSGNFQIVLRTSVMNEEPGWIQIVAFYTW